MINIKKIAIIPEPLLITVNDDNFILNEETVIYSENRLNLVNKYLMELLLPVFGKNLNINLKKEKGNNENSIILRLLDTKNPLGLEGYQIE
ncbi:MAG: glycoside hydrolase family 20 zincin-like fold domain-containing protein, partial [Candidatus Thorarchaeota archaeon]